ncbi:unnamed protein product, partial [Didymodactylos carnosus]
CTRLLIHRHDENLLEKAILNGHLTLAKQIIEVLKIDTLKRQNEYGENVLLLVAKLNYKDLIEAVLEKYVELVYDTTLNQSINQSNDTTLNQSIYPIYLVTGDTG